MAKILVVDDEPAVLRTVARVLEGADRSVDTATDGESAIYEEDPCGRNKDSNQLNRRTPPTSVTNPRRCAPTEQTRRDAPMMSK